MANLRDNRRSIQINYNNRGHYLQKRQNFCLGFALKVQVAMMEALGEGVGRIYRISGRL
jgi:hypothetical protein